MGSAPHRAILLIIDLSRFVRPMASSLEAKVDTLLRCVEKLPGMITVDTAFVNDQLWLGDQWQMADEVRISLERGAGSSRLFDGVQFAVTDLENRMNELPQHAKPESVHVVVVSAGIDDASTEIDKHGVGLVLHDLKSRLGWRIRYFGASLEVGIAV